MTIDLNGRPSLKIDTGVPEEPGKVGMYYGMWYIMYRPLDD